MFTIDYKSRIPFYQQIINDVERLTARGVLQPDSQLPSVRALAMELSINPNTIAKAYGELEARGIIYSLPGRGSFICASGDSIRLARRQCIIEQLTTLSRDAAQLDVSRADFVALAEQAYDAAAAKEDDV
ncbi:MAG: GntR family transcriptional regulator [Bacillota bacterium]|nr:GntR family transcriptional regulator [Bacillota bacterium]